MLRTKGFLLVGAGIVALAIAGCGGGGGDAAPAAGTAESIVGTWTLESGDGPNGEVKPVASSPITLEIAADGTASGTGGCNNVNTQITVGAEGALTVGPVASTLMACEEDVMAAEFAFTTALEGATKATVSEGKLELIGEGIDLKFAKS